MSKFKSFLERSKSPVEEKLPVSRFETNSGAKRERGRPRKPAHLKHPRSKDVDQCGPDGRVLRKFRKKGSIGGNRHYAAKRATKRRADKRAYERRKLAQAVWRKTMRRKWSVWSSKARRRAAKGGVEFRMTYAEFLLLWLGKEHLMGQARLGGAYLARVDTAGPYSRGNLAVFRDGERL